VDGDIVGKQAERHGPEAAYAIPLIDAVIQFDVQMNGCRQAIARLNDTLNHVCRVIVTPDGLAAQKDDHDGPDMASPLGKVALPIRTGEWKTVLIEISGEVVVASIDCKSVIGSDASLARPKATFAFVVSGSCPRFRNLRIRGTKRIVTDRRRRI
jgi:hypothetical protein